MEFDFMPSKKQRSLEEIMADDVAYKNALRNPQTTTNTHQTQKAANKSQEVFNKKHKNFRMYLHTNSFVEREGFFS